MPQRKHKRQRLGSSTCPSELLSATHPDHVWALDFNSTRPPTAACSSCSTSLTSTPERHLRFVVAQDRYRPNHRSLGPHRCYHRPVPPVHRCDNGPELTANAIRDWCRFSGAGTSYIEPGCPWENPFVESFGSRLRDEL